MKFRARFDLYGNIYLRVCCISLTRSARGKIFKGEEVEMGGEILIALGLFTKY